MPDRKKKRARDLVAEGGFVAATPGGSQVMVGDGDDEFIIPLSHFDFLTPPTAEQLRALIDKIRRRDRG